MHGEEPTADTVDVPVELPDASGDVAEQSQPQAEPEAQGDVVAEGESASGHDNGDGEH